MSAAEKREALKPCPFCGGEASKVTTFIGAFWFQCLGCGAQGPHKGVGDREIAWNRRAPLPDEEGMVERVARAMWAVECEEATEEYKRDNRPVPLQWADPWVEGGSGVRQQKPYLRRARAALRAINGGEP